MSRVVFLLLASLVAVVYGQTFGLGSCPTATPQSPIDMNLISGKWYEYARSINAAEATGACQTITVALNSTSKILKVTAKQYDATLNGAEKIMNGTGAYNSTLGMTTIDFSGTKAVFTVIKTDYTNYMAVESCADFWIFHFKNIWVYSRARFTLQSTVDPAYAALTAQKFSVSSMNKTDQLLCPLFH